MPDRMMKRPERYGDTIPRQRSYMKQLFIDSVVL